MARTRIHKRKSKAALVYPRFGHTGDWSPKGLMRRVIDTIVKYAKHGPILAGPDGQLSEAAGAHILSRALKDLKKLQRKSDAVAVRSSTLHPLEASRMILTVVCAWANKRAIPWDSVRYDGKTPARRAEKYYEPVTLGYFEEPCSIVDKHGKVILWSLPKIVSKPRMRHIGFAIQDKALAKLLKSSRKSEKGNPSWRKQGFVNLGSDAQMTAGILDFSPGWFQQRQERLEDKLYVSRPLQAEAGHRFLANIAVAQFLMNGITSVTASSLFEAGNAALQRLYADPELAGGKHPGINAWQSCFSGIELIVNRKTKAHLDSAGPWQSFDFLLTGGTYNSCQFAVQNLNASFNYCPGSVIGIAGRSLVHEVASWDAGERFCLAHFMRDAVHERCAVASPNLPSHNDYIP